MIRDLVAVVGASGFIGNRAVELFHLSGAARVRPVVRRPNALALAGRFGLDGRIADARDPEALERAFEGCRYVIHAVAGDPATILGSIAPVYRAAAAAGVRRLVYLSTASVHGQAPLPGTDERSPLSVRQPIAYNNAKVRAERRLAELRRSGPVEVVILRPGIVHGPRSYWTGGFADELLDGTAYLVEGGHGICNAIYVDNLVHAVRLAMTAPRADGEAFIVADAETVTWADLCRPVAEALGVRLEEIAVERPSRAALAREHRLALLKAGVHRLPAPISSGLRAAYATLRQARAEDQPGSGRGRRLQLTEEKVALHTCATRLPIDKARLQLGYMPRIGFEEACRRSVAWLRFAGYPMAGGEPVATNSGYSGETP